MRILMLGWEFPPFIAGGLGTACHGLTKALDRRGHRILFVLPRPVDAAPQTHVHLIGPRPIVTRSRTHPASHEFAHTSFYEVEAPFSSPYPQFESPDEPGVTRHEVVEHETIVEEGREEVRVELPEVVAHHYGSDLVGDAARYARQVLSIAQQESFDVIHAHDWLTYPAGLAARAATGKPLVCHVHATEFDRSGDSVNPQVYEIERSGMHGCDHVIAVSALTKSICSTRYNVPAEKIQVVYNGVDQDSAQPEAGVSIRSSDRIILFLGRITMQKGPEYFIRAAARVLEKEQNVKFVVAGSGDMALGMIEHAARLGIGHKVLFTGFLRGRDVERVFRM
ncbi:MAG: glycosyltransferase family 4 protein, partial [Phycisphaerales bacterium]|nr:glycosyltransferase family 4 protein [Phycisphaerales bacterium]